MIVALEGCDGAGKDTVARLLRQSRAFAPTAPIINFPDDSARTGPVIRSYLRQEWQVTSVVGRPSDHLGAVAFQALMLANRLERMDQIRRAQREKADLILVRYWQSGVVYGALDGLDPRWLAAVQRTFVGADLNILLRASAETCMRRRQIRDGQMAPERYEGKLERTRQIVAAYDQLWDEAPGPGAWIVIDTEEMNDPQQVADEIAALVMPFRQNAEVVRPADPLEGVSPLRLAFAQYAHDLKEIRELKARVTALQTQNTVEVQRRQAAEYAWREFARDGAEVECDQPQTDAGDPIEIKVQAPGRPTVLLNIGKEA